MSHKNINLLVIEDDSIDQEQIRRLLPDTYTLHLANTGAAGLALFKATPPDAVLLDYRLPDMEASHLLASIHHSEIPVVILTTEENTQHVIDVMKQGAADYLLKRNLSTTTLNHALSNALEKAHLQQSLREKQQRLAEQALTLATKNQQVRELTSALTLAEQRERQRIAQILHDEVQQMLYGVRMRAHLIEQDMLPAARNQIQEHLTTMENLIEHAIDTTRNLAVELNPPILKGEGLEVAFKWLAAQMQERHGLQVEITTQGNCEVEGQDLKILIFQLVRELLFNVVKHAKVNEAKVVLMDDGDYLRIRIQDHGQGFDPEALLKNTTSKTGFGLYSIRERLALFGGQLELESAPGEGVRATIVTPRSVA